ncbi:MAG: hypothetical protein IJ603_01730 [Bacteroidales bacterium]|nr:hypothetical protein [Bacteroidales bacterium]
MRNLAFLSLLALGVLLPGCVLLEDGLTGARRRTDCSREGARPQRPRDGSALPGLDAAANTTLWICAVRFPEGYDWQRDSAYGSIPFELVLYKDFAPVLTLPSGPEACFTPDPARHHLLEGHLYTERFQDGQTRIGRDGVELCRFDGREMLAGLLEDGGDLHTLSRPGPGPGFSFRKNGEVLLQDDRGVLFGDLADPSYGPGGALYRDAGSIVFCYRDAASGAGRLVADGQEQAVPHSAGALDLKRRDGRMLPLPATVAGLQLEEGRLWPEEGGFAVTGRFRDAARGSYTGYLPVGGQSARVLCAEEAVAYSTPGAGYAVAVRADGTVRRYGPGMPADAVSAHFMSPACAVTLGGRLVLALTPRDAGAYPQVHIGEQVREIPLNGYISCVGVSLPN